MSLFDMRVGSANLGVYLGFLENSHFLEFEFESNSILQNWLVR